MANTPIVHNLKGKFVKPIFLFLPSLIGLNFAGVSAIATDSDYSRFDSIGTFHRRNGVDALVVGEVGTD